MANPTAKACLRTYHRTTVTKHRDRLNKTVVIPHLNDVEFADAHFASVGKDAESCDYLASRPFLPFSLPLLSPFCHECHEERPFSSATKARLSLCWENIREKSMLSALKRGFLCRLGKCAWRFSARAEICMSVERANAHLHFYHCCHSKWDIFPPFHITLL